MDMQGSPSAPSFRHAEICNEHINQIYVIGLPTSFLHHVFILLVVEIGPYYVTLPGLALYRPGSETPNWL